jgi:hypothetical protein
MMTRVTISRQTADPKDPTYRAAAGPLQTVGRTAGEAVDALAAQLPEDQAGTLIIVRDLRPDRYFTEEQRQRLGELMARWRSARDAGAALPEAEQTELERLVDEEVRAAGKRAAELLRELDQ